MPGERDLLREVLGVTRLLERDALLPRLIAAADRIFSPTASCAVTLEDRGGLVCTASRGIDDESFARSRLRVILTERLAVRGPLVGGVLEAADLSGIGIADSSADRALLVPLEVESGRVGALVLLYDSAAAMPESAPDLATRFVLLLEPVLSNLIRFKELSELVIRDDTTHCFNRRFLDQGLVEEVERSRRFGKKFAVIFLDMDDLKQVNTRHGHSAGSGVLREAARRITSSVRGIDRVHRYGGDEFVVILPGTDARGAREVAERIRAALTSAPFDVGGTERVTLSASSGLAIWPDFGPTGRKTMMAADSAMRRVKATMKGRIGSAADGGGGGAE